MAHPAAAHGYDVLYDPLTIAAMTATAASAALQASATAAAGRAEEEAGLARQEALQFQAKQARINAGQEKATSQRAAIEERRKGRLIESRALAVGAASGVGVSSLENVFGDLGAEEEYRSAVALFQGDVAARDLNLQADALVFEGDQEARAGRIAKKLRKRQAFGQLATGASSAFGTAALDPKAREFASKAIGKIKTTLSSGRGLSRFTGPR